MSEANSKSQGAKSEPGQGQTFFVPRVDIVENEHGLTLYADLPGVAPDQLEVRYNDGQLTLHGKVTARQQATPYQRKEYEVGDFHRVFTVGELIDAAKISAELKNGVLTLELPKVERARPRRIEVRCV